MPMSVDISERLIAGDYMLKKENSERQSIHRHSLPSNTLFTRAHLLDLAWFSSDWFEKV